MPRIHEASKLTGASTDQIRYLEKKGYIESTWKELKQRRVRDYSDTEVLKIQLIVKYLSQGFKYSVAYEKAMDELRRPRLLL